MKHVKNELGGTVNDVILAAVAGALGRYMRSRGHATVGLELRAMVPVSVRTADQHGTLGNQVTAMMAPLPVWCEDPVRRMEIVRESMGDLKASKQAMGASLITQLADFAPPTLAGQAARLQSRQRFFNLVVTNIPGPQFPLYLMGRRMERVFPMVPLAKNQGGLHRDHELRRPGQLRPDRRLRRDARPRGPGRRPRGVDRRADRGGRRPPGLLQALRPARRRRRRRRRAERARRARGIDRPADVPARLRRGSCSTSMRSWTNASLMVVRLASPQTGSSKRARTHAASGAAPRSSWRARS